jgi:anion-transporting  ArsA/GET3 family ATPase
LQQLGSKRLLVVTGKGGVGKSTLSATLGLILVRAGKRVLLLETDPRESLYQLLDVPPSGGAIVQVVPGLFVQNLQPRDVLDQLVREHVRLGVLADRVLSSPVYRHFAEGAPGLEEMAVIAHAQRVVDSRAGKNAPTVDLVVMDAPATGHGLSLLEAPLLVSEVICDGPVGRLGGKLARFVRDPALCGVVLVTAAEEMPVQEAVELIDALEVRFSRGPDLVLVNGLYPPCEAGPLEGPNQGQLPLWRERRGVNERELDRLSEAWSGLRIDLPLLPLDRGPDLVAALQERLEPQLGASR